MLLALVAASGLGVTKLGAQVDVTIYNRFGEPLRHPRIVRFDGETFQVEHDGGIAAMPWAKMPPAFRLGYRHQPEVAAETRRLAEARRRAVEAETARASKELSLRKEAARRAAKPKATPLIVERSIRRNDLYILPTIGGPAGELRILRVTQTEITFGRHRFDSQTVEKKLGFGNPRTLLFSDGRGCDVYYVDRYNPVRYEVFVQFEYAEDATSRPSGLKE